ncbi:cyclic 2,3-diphosphoglycerate synthase [Candidatus Riflebacteria bacterium]
MGRRKVLIMGAAGRDFHNFNLCFRENPAYEVVAFTAAQIPDIEGRKYPHQLCGKLYPEGIPILAEEELGKIIQEKDIDEVVFSYSDVPHEYVMNKASMVMALGADFTMLGTKSTQLKAEVPVVSICAVRTGCGKSQTTRKVAELLQGAGKKVVAIRHPMPYGDLVKQKVMRFASLEDLEKHNCTIEEMEEFEPHINRGVIVYCGVDYKDILEEAQKEADIILWDGGNNDLPFYEANLNIVVVDPHRAGHELSYHPGETNFRLADVLIINKLETADSEDILEVRDNIREANPEAIVVDAASPVYVNDSEIIRGKRVLVVEDGPTLTHGSMAYGAGVVAAEKFGASELVDPRPYLVGKLKETFETYPEIGQLLPAMGYGEEMKEDMSQTINNTDCDLVIIATPIDLTRICKINKPTVMVNYELQEIGKPDLKEILKHRGII